MDVRVCKILMGFDISCTIIAVMEVTCFWQRFSFRALGLGSKRYQLSLKMANDSVMH